MTKRCRLSGNITDEFPGSYEDYRDEELMRALVTAGALVALSDGYVEAIERDELVNFVDQQGFVPTISRQEIIEAFDWSVKQLEDRLAASVIVAHLRPFAGLSLSVLVLHTAEVTAAADGIIHPGELRAIKLIQLIMGIAQERR